MLVIMLEAVSVSIVAEQGTLQEIADHQLGWQLSVLDVDNKVI